MRWTTAIALGCAGACAALAASAPASATPCTAQTGRTLVHEFAARVSSGRAADAERLWAPEPRFYWYSTSAPTGRRLGKAAYRRSTLLGYLRGRMRAHERLHVVELRARYDPGRRLVNFHGRLVRGADDMEQRLLDFKGAADCDPTGPRLIVWSM